MEITHEYLESLLKTMFEKLRVHLCLKFTTEEYEVQLSDGISGDAVILNGDIVTIKIRTKLFVEVITKKYSGNEFRQLMEVCLRQVPRMKVTLTHQPVADVLHYDYEKRKFLRLTQAEYNKLNPSHPYEKEIYYQLDFRTTAIHWKSGVVVRETGKSAELSHHNARRKILSLLNDPEIYRRAEDKFIVVESHDDIIYDLLIQAKALSKDEVKFLIKQLEKEHG